MTRLAKGGSSGLHLKVLIGLLRKHAVLILNPCLSGVWREDCSFQS